MEISLLVGAGFIALILFRRDLHTVSGLSHEFKFSQHNIEILFVILLQIIFFLGTILNEIFNKILKNWIQEPRPIERLNMSDQYGMPSSHSQFIWFFSTYSTLFILFRFEWLFLCWYSSISWQKKNHFFGNLPSFHY